MKRKEAGRKFHWKVSAVQWCHQKWIVYSDQKAENLLLGANTNIKIADSGFSNKFTFGNQMHNFCGNKFAAPEPF
ncbi:Serine/threonine-protein kinase MARK2 [Camelus dromedarius]|uniref:non-specific serine/threonine protein kinase n=1 Tax=Camelus dromedarius TaxID=9838 RepID=A0A5N4DKK5_CAMDR|nr:Serine/threonine-protein kinase MARK2 [Camelus dromedarius]